MTYEIQTIIASIFGTLGFGMLFKLKPSALVVCSFGGMITWCICLLTEYLGCGLFTSNLCASVFAILFSSFVAIKMKLPATILFTTCIIPLVPGGSLYYTMHNLIFRNYEMFYEYGSNSVLTAVGISGGMIIGSIFFAVIRKPHWEFKKHHNRLNK